MRPASSQIDLWPSLGLDLNWTTYLAAGKKGEIFTPPSPAQVTLGAGYNSSVHGFTGPLTTCISPHMTTGDIHNIFNDTFKALGIPPRDDFDGGELRGFGVQVVTQNEAEDIREDAAHAYYYPFMDRENLVVMVNTTATRIIWSDDTSDGEVIASGAEILVPDGTFSTIYADKEVIISAGSLRTPAILEHSGIGQPSLLASLSINLTVDLPAVGENLQDQTVLSIAANATNQNFTGFPAFVAHASLQDLLGTNTSSFFNSTLAKLPEYGAMIAEQNGGGSSAEVQQELLESQLELLYNSNTPAIEIVPFALGAFVGFGYWPLQ